MAEQSNNTGKVVAIILIIVFVLAALVSAWYWFMYKPEQEAKERARQEQLAREKAEQERLAQEQAQNQLRYDKLILDADSLFILRRWENARSLYIDALAILPDQTYPRDQITLINSKLEMSAGEVETITESTGRFYVIISSSLDDDLAMDYAKKLSDAGNNVKVVEHQMNKNTYFGVSLGDYDTWDQAVSATLEFNSYGEGVWVLKW
ncbi:MAG: hypothetical protein KI791_01865 [Cyclobacteriaceae bacterium]|nr:hypothetical protein [Cyclobacteriaceae bacterium SS2]